MTYVCYLHFLLISTYQGAYCMGRNRRISYPQIWQCIGQACTLPTCAQQPRIYLPTLPPPWWFMFWISHTLSSQDRERYNTLIQTRGWTKRRRRPLATQHCILPERWLWPSNHSAPAHVTWRILNTYGWNRTDWATHRVEDTRTLLTRYVQLTQQVDIIATISTKSGYLSSLKALLKVASLCHSSISFLFSLCTFVILSKKQQKCGKSTLHQFHLLAYKEIKDSKNSLY